MTKVKITKKPVYGNQYDFSLYDGYTMENHGSDDLNSTLKAVDKENANAEAEKGEVIVGDLNKDGFLEQMVVGGKPHSKGGTPIHMGKGDFIFSNTRKLKIKNPDVLEHFGEKTPKTPADIAKKYKINEYIKTLKSDPDPIAERTATMMLQNNQKKLSELSLIQESMKNFPTGVPDIATPLLSGDIVLRDGGELPKFQAGGSLDQRLKKYQVYIPREAKPQINNDPNAYYPVGTIIGYTMPDGRNISPEEMLALAIKNAVAQAQSDGEYVKIAGSTYRIDSIKDEYPEIYQAVSPKAKTAPAPAPGPPQKTAPSTPGTPVPKRDVKFGQYDGGFQQDLIRRAEESGFEVKKARQDYGKFKTQSIKERGNVYRPEGSEEFDIEDFKSRHGDWIQEEYGSFEKFVQDAYSDDVAVAKKAARWFQETYNKHTKDQYGVEYFTEYNPDNPYSVDELFGAVTYSAPRIFGAAKKKEETKTTPVTTNQIATPEDLQSDIKPQRRGWWLQDLNNAALAASQPVNMYAPAMFQVPLVNPDPTFLDPSRQVAAGQEMYNKQQDLIESTSQGQVARANSAQMAGNSSEQIANVLSQYEQQNVGIANQFAQNNATATNQNAAINTELRKKYIDEMAVANQQYDTSKFRRRTNVTNAFNQGHTNMQQTNWMNELYPQYNVNRITGDIDFMGGPEMTADPAAQQKTFEETVREGMLMAGSKATLADGISYAKYKLKIADQEPSNDFANYLKGIR